MEKKLKYLIENLKNVLNINEINTIAKKSKFVQRQSNINAKDFILFNTFYGEEVCKVSLSQLASKYDAIFNVAVSKQAVNKRFNKYAVEFMKEIFNQLMFSQNSILNNLKNTLYFHRIIINDSTGFNLPKEFADEFFGSGGSASPSAIKIQLQYELLSGMFMKADIFSGTKNDVTYLDVMETDSRPKDLKLADLGYHKIDYLKKIDANGASYISKVKSSFSLYSKNKNPELNLNGEIKKKTEYIKIDILELMKPLAEGETIELKDIYIGSKKELKNRLIITKLTEENKRRRELIHKENIRKKKRVLTQERFDFNAINAYITNVNDKILSKDEIHDIYTLRWQIEIMFKIWKSIFKINEVKKVKIERFKCFLYGRLIALLLSSSIVFTAKNIILEETNQEISEIKSFGSIFQYLPKLATIILKTEIYLLQFLKKITLNFKRFCLKTNKKQKKSVNDILKILKIELIQSDKIAS